MTATLEKTGSAKKKRDEDRKLAYLTLVADVHDGVASGDDETAADILEAVNMTEADLARDVSRLRAWRGLQTEYAKFPVLLAERDTLNAEIDVAAAEFRALKDAHDEKLFPLRHRVDAINQELIREHDIRQRLLQTCPAAELASKYRNLNSRLTANGRNMAAAINRHDTLVADAESSQPMFAPGSVAQMDAQIEALRTEETNLLAEIKSTMEAMITA